MVITDNRTGKVVFKNDICALLGAAQVESNCSAALVITECNAIAIAATALNAQKAINNALREVPEAHIMYMMAYGDDEDDDNDEDEE